MKHLYIYILFAISATVVLLNRYTPLYINNNKLHFLVLFIAAATFVIIIGHFFGKLRTNKSIAVTFVLVGLACFLKAFLTWGGDWKTQEIYYRNIENKNKTIQFQMRGDRFAFGYKKRVVAINHIAPFMDWSTDIDTIAMDHSKWEKLNLKVNDLGLQEK